MIRYTDIQIIQRLIDRIRFITPYRIFISQIPCMSGFFAVIYDISLSTTINYDTRLPSEKINVALDDSRLYLYNKDTL